MKEEEGREATTKRSKTKEAGGMRDSATNWENRTEDEEDDGRKETSAGETKASMREEEDEQKNRYTTRFKLCYSFLICDNSQILKQTIKRRKSKSS